MADYSRCKTETLKKKRDKAFSAYYREAIKPCGNWHKGMKFTALKKAEARLEAIDAEFEKRSNALK